MQSEIFRAGWPKGHSEKSLYEIGLKAPSNIYQKNVRRRSSGRNQAESSGGVGERRCPPLAWSSEHLAAILPGFRAAFEATSWGSRWGIEPFAAPLSLTPKLTTVFPSASGSWSPLSDSSAPNISRALVGIPESASPIRRPTRGALDCNRGVPSWTSEFPAGVGYARGKRVFQC